MHLIDAQWRRAVMESIRDGMMLFDSEGLIVEMNQAFTDLFGYALEDGPFHPPYPWWPTAEEDAQALEEIRSSYAKITSGEATEHEFTFYTSERRPIWVHSSGTSIHHAALGTTHLRVVRDITRVKEAQLRRAAAADVSQAFAVVAARWSARSPATKTKALRGCAASGRAAERGAREERDGQGACRQGPCAETGLPRRTNPAQGPSRSAPPKANHATGETLEPDSEGPTREGG